MKEKVLNLSIQEVCNLFKQLKNEGYTLEEISKMILETE